MKKLLLLLLVPFFAFVADKYSVTLPLSAWDKHNAGLNYVVNAIENSTLPANQVKFMRDSIIIPLQQDIVNQVRKQMPKDSTGKK